MNYYPQRQHDTWLSLPDAAESTENELLECEEGNIQVSFPSNNLHSIENYIATLCDILKCVIINFSPEKTEVVRIDGSKKKKDEPRFLWLGMHMDVIPSAAFLCVCSLCCVQSHPSLCNPMDYSPLIFSIHGIFRQKYWSGLPFPPPGDLPNPGIKHMLLSSLALAGRFFTPVPPGKPWFHQHLSVIVMTVWEGLTNSCEKKTSDLVSFFYKWLTSFPSTTC